MVKRYAIEHKTRCAMNRLLSAFIWPTCGRPSVVPLVFLLALLSVPAMGRQHLIGSVQSRRTKEPVAGATVKVESEVPTISIEVRTDPQGRFRFSPLPPGAYRVTVTAAGFYPLAVLVTLAPRVVQPVDVELEPIAQVVEQMDVRAEPLLLDETQGASIALVEEEFLRRLPDSRRANLPEMVAALVPSAVAGHDNLVHLRGNELSLNISINGVSFLDNPHASFTPGMNPDVIRSVTVITGGFPAEYGNRFGGILDVVTRSGFDEDRHGTIRFGASTHLRHTAALDYGGHTKRFGYFLSASGFESQRFLNPPEPRAFHDVGKGARAFAQVDYRAGATDTVRLVLFGGGTNLQIPNTEEQQHEERDFFQRNREQTAILTWTHAFSADALLVTSAYGRVVSARLLPTSDPHSIQAAGTRYTSTFGLRSDYTRFLGSRHTLKGGLDLTLFRLREDVIFDPRDHRGEIEPFGFRGRETGGQLSLYLQDRLSLFRNVTANVGVRYDQYTLLTSEAHLSPRLNLAYSIPRAGTVIHFAYNRFFAPPPLENLLLSAHLGTAAPAPARSHHWEVGVSQALSPGLRLRVRTFRRDDRNSFETTELANVRQFLPTTLARGRAYGAELSLEVMEIARLGLSGFVTYTAQRAFQIGPIAGGFADEEIPPGARVPAAFDQIHTGTAGVLWRHRRTGLWAGLTFEYGSGTPAELPAADALREEDEHEPEATLVRLPQHLIVNVSMGIDLFRRERRRIGLQFNIENLTDRVYPIAKESAFTPVQFSSPRFFSGSVAVRF